MKNKIVAALVFLCMACPYYAHAGKEAGNGGDVVLQNGKYILLDYLEAGANPDATFDPRPDERCQKYTLPFCGWYLNQYSSLPVDLAPVSADVWNGLVNRLSSMDDYSAMAVYKTLTRLYQLRFVDAALIQIHDIQSPLDLSQLKIYQIAVRQEDTITINKTLCDQLSSANKAGLLLHEALYSMLRPHQNADGTQSQDSYAARQVVGELALPAHAPQGDLEIKLSNYMDYGQYRFSLFDTAFGDYGLADDYIGWDVSDAWNSILTGAYIKINGQAVPSNAVEESRIKETFLSGLAAELCAEFKGSTGSHFNLTLVRTSFELSLQNYPSANGGTKCVSVKTTELPFSEWYLNSSMNDHFVIDAPTQDACIAQVLAADKAISATMKLAPDAVARWWDGH